MYGDAGVDIITGDAGNDTIVAGLGIGDNLSGFPAPPAFERDRVNCDEMEIAMGECLAIDGVTKITLMSSPGHGGGPVAKDILPMSIRPDSDFHWRSDPHQINGNASTLMDPGGDMLAAYWLARASELGGAEANLSPFARPPLPYTLDDGGAGGAGGGGMGGSGGGSGAAPPEESGCSACAAAGAERAPLPALGGASALLGLALLVARRGRRRS